MRYIIGQLNIYILTLAYKIKHLVAQSLESLTLKPDFAGSRPGGATYFLQIIFLHLSPLLLICISEVFDVSRVSSSGSFTYKIFSNDTVDPYLKYFTFSMLLITLKWTIFHVLFTNAYSLICNRIVWILF